MANCIQCGKELPTVTVGDLKDTCVECQVRQRIARDQEARANRPTTWQIAQMFPVTSSIVAINLVVFAACAIQTLMSGRGSLLNFNSLLLLSWGANYGPLTLDHQFWRIFTCMFVHGGLIHVGANMWCFWDFGRIAERVFGRGRFAIIYVLTGLASSIASLAIHPTTPSVGASGAIFGVVGALVFPFYRKRVVLPSPVLKAMMRSLLTFIVINLLIGSAVPFIDNAAHVGGLLAGLALGAVITQLSMLGHDLTRVFPRVAAVTAVLIGFAFAGVQHLHRDSVLPVQALLALDQGNTQEALQSAQRAVAKNPASAIANYALGSALLELHRYQEAVGPLQQAVKLDPQNADFKKTLETATAQAASQSLQSK